MAGAGLPLCFNAAPAAGMGGCVSVRVSARVVFSSSVHETFCYSYCLLPSAVSFQSIERDNLFSSAENTSFQNPRALQTMCIPL